MTNKLIFIIISAVVMVAAGAILAWQFWPRWVCGDTLFYQGKDYDTVQIGDQCWFAENLDYDNGCREVLWVAVSDEGWCGYYKDTDYSEGLLYQWSAAMNGVATEGAQGLCPDGWHIPTDFDWTDLEIQICQDIGNSNCNSTFNGTTIWRGQDTTTANGEGSAMAGNEGLWLNGNLDHQGAGDNDFGTSGLDVFPAGSRRSSGSYLYREVGAYLWSSTESNSNAWCRYLGLSPTGVGRVALRKANAFSVRCLKY